MLKTERTILKTENRTYKTIMMYCSSLFYNYDKIEPGKEYSYKELISLITDLRGNQLPEKASGERRVPQLDALRITLDIEDRGTTQNKKYFIKAKHNYSLLEKQEIIDQINQDFLLTRNNKKGLIYNVVLCLLYLRGRTVHVNGKIHKSMEFSKSGWETEIGLVSRVFQKMLYNYNNILTKTILGNILKVSVDEAKKNVFARALDFIMDDADICCTPKTKVLFINEDDDAANVNLCLPQIEYKGRQYNYKLGYALPLLEDAIKRTEEMTLESMGYVSRGAVIGDGQYNNFQKKVRAQIRKMNSLSLIEPIKSRNNGNLFKDAERFEVEMAKSSKITILGYWKTYQISIDPEKLNDRIQKIINGAQFENFDKKFGSSYLENYNTVSEYTTLLKLELNEFIKNKIAEKAQLDKIDYESEAGKALIQELSWLGYFAKHSQYRKFQEAEWKRYLLGNDSVGGGAIDGGEELPIIYNNNGVAIGFIDENFNYIDTRTGDVTDERVDAFEAIKELDAFTTQIIGHDDKLDAVKEAYNEKMNTLIQNSLVLSQNGEISKIGPDLEAMNDKIRELMEMQFIPQGDALRYAYMIVKDKKLLIKQLMLQLMEKVKDEDERNERSDRDERNN